jgi:hypothetical protein
MSVPRYDQDGQPIPPGPAFGMQRQQDAQRRAEDAERREELGELSERGTVAHEAMAEYAEAEAAALEELAIESDGPNGGAVLDNAIIESAKQANERVEEASLDPNVKLAKAIAAELQGQVLETTKGATYIPLADDVDHEGELEAYLEQPDDDEVVGTDELGRTVFKDAEGVEYVLTDGD